jgi:hypothetical protein
MRRPLAYLTLAVCLALPANAIAGGGQQLVNDCTDNGKIDGKYSAGDYKDALNNIPTDVDEYTDCRDIIRQSQVANTGQQPERKTAFAPTETPAGPPAPAEKQQIARQRARFSHGNPVRIGGVKVTPGSLSRQAGSAGFGNTSNDLPVPVLVLLLAIAALTLAGTALFGRDAIPAIGRRISRFRRGSRS